jgi:hypothetical protein
LAVHAPLSITTVGMSNQSRCYDKVQQSHANAMAHNNNNREAQQQNKATQGTKTTTNHNNLR